MNNKPGVKTKIRGIVMGITIGLGVGLSAPTYAVPGMDYAQMMAALMTFGQQFIQTKVTDMITGKLGDLGDKLNGVLNQIGLSTAGIFNRTGGYRDFPMDIPSIANGPGREAIDSIDSISNTSIPDTAKAIEMTRIKQRAKEQANINDKMAGMSTPQYKAYNEAAVTGLNDSNKTNIERNKELLDPEKQTNIEETLVNYVYKYATGRTDHIGLVSGDIEKLANFLTPQPMPLPNGEINNDPKTGLRSDDQLRVLSNVLMGVDSAPTLTARALSTANGYSLQAATFTKYSRFALARAAVDETYNKQTLQLMNAEYKKWVVSPQLEDARGATDVQHLYNITKLIQGTNMELLLLRRNVMEQSRLIGILLATQIENSKNDKVMELSNLSGIVHE
jgi:hypothetical protein